MTTVRKWGIDDALALVAAGYRCELRYDACVYRPAKLDDDVQCAACAPCKAEWQKDQHATP